jgi:acyl-homoserine-lactone acylase
MRRLALLLLIAPLACAPTDPEIAAWEEQASGITIIRDDWGVPHIYGETDADAVFGMIYAQAEDDFNRIEQNYLLSMGRMAEAEGEAEIWRDLRMRLFIDPAAMQALYARSPAWLRALMDAWADGLNWYLHTHPEVTPRVITRFEPWMALTFSEGSIGGDIERVSLRDLESFYGRRGSAAVAGNLPDAGQLVPADLYASAREPLVPLHAEPVGSNGFAIAPSNSATGNALLWINPHTSFFFREELHMVSREGLDAYGAVTWGQFFVYQGFNEDAGWMHTSSGVDNIDEFLETVVEREDGLFYRYGDEERPVVERVITVPYRSGDSLAHRTFKSYRTHHGPVVRAEGDRWVAVSLMEDPLGALAQSYSRTKARNYAEYRETMEGHTNSSNNTVFADSEGNIAYFHSNFIPRRDPRFDYARPVDGSDPATDWNGVLSIDESPNVLNPPNGWIQNTNNWPYSAAGEHSPDREDYPAYVQTGGENARGVNAVRVLSRRTDFTMDSLTEAAFDPYLSAFADMIPPLVAAWDAAPASPLKDGLAGPIEALRGWDFGWGLESVPTTVAVYWGEEVFPRVAPVARGAGSSVAEAMRLPAARTPILEALRAATDTLVAHFGSWETPWGEVNRFQRLTGDIEQPFSDDGPSIPVGFTSSRWGSLASFGARAWPGTVKRYGTSGNSFVAVVEFGDSLRARAVTAGGLNSDPANPHFNDQAERYAAGDLREVYFYRSQLDGHIEREYRPGQ